MMSRTEESAKREHWASRANLERYEREMGAYALAIDEAIIGRFVGAGRGLAMDVPCGTGRFADLLASKGYHVIAADYSEAMLRVRATRDASAGIRCDAFRLPFRDDAFDLVACMRLTFHYENSAALLAELVRITKPGGTIVFDSLNRFSIRHGVEAALVLGLRRAGERIWFTSAQSWMQLAARLGCEVKDSDARYVLPTRAYRLIPGFLHGLLRIIESGWPSSLRVLRYWKLMKLPPQR
jgi:SAM-dependent methyltransferase